MLKKIIEWGVIPARSSRKKSGSPDGHRGFFSYSTTLGIGNGEFRTPVYRSIEAAKVELMRALEQLNVDVSGPHTQK